MTYTDLDCGIALRELDCGKTWPDLEQSMPGIQAAVRRYQAKLRKRNSRASAEQRIELPLPAGTAAALRRVCEAAGDEPVALLATVVHQLDHIMLTDPATFEFLTRPPRADVSKVAARYAHLVGGPEQESEE
jgi:hypothetical protein